jgi:L,D-peptidoglycan transpeptidase YkuD (ErfK/YbiS/YcfS/YnhG family)
VRPEVDQSRRKEQAARGFCAADGVRSKAAAAAAGKDRAVEQPCWHKLRIHARPGRRPHGGWLLAGSLRLPVALGGAGLVTLKREGDGATPRGQFRPVRLWWRADSGVRPRTGLPVRRIRRGDAWCEDPGDRRYNRPIRLSEGVAGDRLWRADRLYDLVLEIDHNCRPRIKGRGSAIFIHVARPDLAPTAGCVALPAAGLRRLLARLCANTRIRIG